MIWTDLIVAFLIILAIKATPTKKKPRTGRNRP